MPSQSAYLCASASPSRPSVELPNKLLSQGEPADPDLISSHASKVELVTEELSKDRGILLRMSPIYELPPETLGEVFKHLCYHSSDDVLVPTKIGAICHHWRQIAWSIPQLWTELTIGENFWNSSSQEKMLDLYFENMREFRCNIIFLCVPYYDEDSEDENDQDSQGFVRPGPPAVFNQIFVKHADKLKAFTFHRSPEHWLPLIRPIMKNKQGLPSLGSLAIRDKGDSHNFFHLHSLTFAFDNVPRLRKLQLDETIHTLIFPWLQLTELILHDIHPDASLNIALQCKNLVIFKLFSLFGPGDALGPIVTLPNEPIIFQNLQELWFVGLELSQLWMTALAECLLFKPSLKKLIWSIDGGINGLQNEFLWRLPTSITFLKIDYYGANDSFQDLEEIFAHLTSLQTLELVLDDPMDHEVVGLFTAAGSRRLLPSLCSITFVITQREYDAQQISDLLDIIRSSWVSQEEEGLFEELKIVFPFTEANRLIDDFQKEVGRITGKKVSA